VRASNWTQYSKFESVRFHTGDGIHTECKQGSKTGIPCGHICFMENVALYVTTCCPLKVKLSCTSPTRVMVGDVSVGQLRTVKRWKEFMDGIILRFFSGSRKELRTPVSNKQILWGKVSKFSFFNSQLPILHNDNRLVSLESLQQRLNYGEGYCNIACLIGLIDVTNELCNVPKKIISPSESGGKPHYQR
jgi:hypothetical protein